MKSKQFKSILSGLTLLVFIILAIGSFSVDENTEEYKEAKEKLEKDVFFKNQEAYSIDTKKIFGAWEQYKFTNKETGKSIQGPTLEPSGEPTLIIYKENGEIYIGSKLNNSKIGTFKINNNKIEINYPDGGRTFNTLLNLNDSELVYYPENKSNLIYYHKRVEL